MIVVVGTPVGVAPAAGGGVAGVAARAALAAARAGARVELVGRVGDDPLGDATLLALTAAGVGHAAVLRDPGRHTPLATDATGVEEADDVDEGNLLAEDDAGAVGPLPGNGPEHDAWPTLEPGDVELALRYLPDYSAVVIAEPQAPGVVDVAASAADFAGAHLVVVVEPGSSGPPSAIVLEAPASDSDGAFAALLGELAAAIDAGTDPEAAFRTAVAKVGWERGEA